MGKKYDDACAACRCRLRVVLAAGRAVSRLHPRVLGEITLTVVFADEKGREWLEICCMFGPAWMNKSSQERRYCR